MKSELNENEQRRTKEQNEKKRIRNQEQGNETDKKEPKITSKPRNI